MKLSVVTTMYYSAGYLKEFYNRVQKVLESLKCDYEFIFVDDGSPDNSLSIALQLQATDNKIHVVELSRNFGHHKAVMAGLRESTGDLIYLIDCDLEEEPELLNVFYAKLNSVNCDVVYGVQQKRKGKWRERFFGYIFYKLFNHFAEHKIPENILMSRLMKRAYVSSLLQYDEKDFFLGATFSSVGFRQESVSVVKKNKGSSTYNLARKLSLMVNAIVSSSNRPLVYVFYIGAFISFCVMLGALGVFCYHFFIQPMQVGWPSLVLSIWFLGGLIILCIGIVGIYLSKIYTETKDRPTVIIRKKHSNNQ